MNAPKQANKQLNARRLLCPLPVIRTQNAIKEMHTDDILEVTCTDPGAKQDIPAWSRINGHHIEDICEQDEEIIIRIRVGQQET